MFKKVQPDGKYGDIILQDFGRRPTTLCGIKGLLTLLDKSDGNFAEVGTWTGKTTYEIASRFPDKKIYAFDFLENKISEKEQNARCLKDELCKYAIHLPNVHFNYIHSDNIDYNKYDNISVIFIDGDHSYEGCKRDTEKALKYMENRGSGFIAWHDVINGHDFGVRLFLEREICTKYKVSVFYKSQVGYIEI